VLVALAPPLAGFAQVVLLNDEFRVNSYTTSIQATPVVTPGADGGFVVAWRSLNEAGSNSGNDVFARRYNTFGQPLGTPFRVNEHTTGMQYQIAAASDDAGNFVVVWSSSHEGSNFGVFARRFDAAGTPLGGEFRVNQWTTGTQASPAVAADAAGNFVVVWRGAGPADVNSVYLRRYDAQGQALGGDTRVNTAIAGPQGYPAVASDPAGNFVVVWQSSDDSNFGIFGQRYDAAGAAVGSEFRVNVHTTLAQTRPSVAMDKFSTFVVAWQDSRVLGDYNVMARRFDSFGSPVGGEFAVNTWTTNQQIAPRVASNRRGDFVVTWQSAFQDGSSYGIFGRTYTFARVAGAEFAVNSYTTSLQGEPALAWTSEGRFVTAWSDYGGRDGASAGVFARRLSPDIIFDDGFDNGGVGYWSVISPGGGDLTVTPEAALRDSAWGLSAAVDDTQGLWVQDDAPDDEIWYKARFYFDPNGFDPGEALGHRRTRIFVAFESDPTRRVAAVVLRRVQGAYALMARARVDDNTQVDTPFFSITDAPHFLELSWIRASAPGLANGLLHLWIDGEHKATLTGLDTDLHGIDFVRLGALSVKGGANGTLYFDEFVSRRMTAIGP
jgi:hypothetical protein